MVQTHCTDHIPTRARVGSSCLAPVVELLFSQADLQRRNYAQTKCNKGTQSLTCSVPIALSSAAAMSPRRACCCSSCSCSKVSGGGWMPHVTSHTSHVTRHTSHVTRQTSHTTHSSHLLTHIPPREHPSTLMRAHYIVQRSSCAAPAAARQNAHAISHTTTHEASHTTTNEASHTTTNEASHTTTHEASHTTTHEASHTNTHHATTSHAAIRARNHSTCWRRCCTCAQCA